MAKLTVPFANQIGQASVEQNSRETLVNMFAEIQVSGRQMLIRRQRMCLELVEALSGEKRAIEKNAGVHYLVVGAKFYTFDGTDLTECGTLDTDTGPCSIIFDDNGDVALSDGATLYHWTGVAFSKPEMPSVVGTLTFLGGFAVYSEPDSGRFWWSAVNDMQAWDDLDFATAEGKPDQLVRVFESYKQLWLFGEQTTEIWSLSGGGDSPFTPYTVMERGCGAPMSVVNEDNSLFWLGDDFIFYRADGYRPMTVSNVAVQEQVGKLSDEAKRTCWGFSYTDGFHKFITWTFRGHLTLQYNVATGFWNVARTFERDDWDVLGSQFTGADFVLSGAGISRLTRELNTDNGEVVERGGVSAPISEGLSRILITKFTLDTQVGRAGIGVDPVVAMRVSRNGESFGNERRRRSLGEQGDYRRLVVFRNLGIGRRQMVDLSFTDDAEFSIMGAELEADLLDG